MERDGVPLRVIRLADEDVIPPGPDIARAESAHATHVLGKAMARLLPDDQRDLERFFALAPRMRVICQRFAFYVSEWLPDPACRGDEYQPDCGLLVRCLSDGVTRLRGHPDFQDRLAKQAFLYGLFSAAVQIQAWRVWAPANGVPDGIGPPPAFRREPPGLSVEVWEPLVVPLARWVDRRALRAPYLNPVDSYSLLPQGKVAAMIAMRILTIQEAVLLDWGSVASRFGA